MNAKMGGVPARFPADCRPPPALFDTDFLMMFRCSAWSFALVTCWLAYCVGAAAQEFDLESLDFGSFDDPMANQDPVSISAQFTPATGDRPAVLMVTANIEPGWHVYSLTQPKGGPRAAKLLLGESPDYKAIGDWRSFPAPHRRIDDQIWQGLTLEEHDDQVTWYLPIEFAEGVDVDSVEVTGTASLQACKESCIPFKQDFTAKQGSGVEIGPVEVRKPTNVTTTEPPPTQPEAPRPPVEAGVFRAKDSVVTWYGWLDAGTVKPGGRTFLYLRAEMPAGWHVNAYEPEVSSPTNQPTLIAFEPDDGFHFYYPQRQTEVIEKESPIEGFGMLRYHEGAAVWAVPIDAVTELQPGEYTLEGLLGYQACEVTEGGLGTCELSKGAKFTAKLTVGDAAAASPAAVAFQPAKYKEAADTASQVASTLQVAGSASDNLKIIEFTGASAASNLGLLGMLAAALVGGLILNLMPCVLPVIGLKIMAFAKQGGESRSRVFLLNLAYVAGLISVFLLLATLASLTQWGLAGDDFEWGELNTQTWFKVFMTALVFVMALSFLGVWEIPLPGFAGGSKAAEMASREGYGGAFSKGVLTTILATPCSGPFLGPVFGYTIGQSLAITYLVFLFVGLGMSLPYLLIGAFPALVQWIPKPGMWMETFKQLMAFVLLGTVVYLLSTINSDYYIPTLALLVALWFACWLGGRQPFTAPIARRSVAWTVGLLTAVGVGLVGFSPKSEVTLPWKDYSPDQLAAAQDSGRTVLVDFTADWCLTCQWNLATAIDKPSVKGVVDANNIEVLKADWTDEDEDIEDALMRLRSRSIPLLAIYPAGRPNEVIVLRDTVTQTQVLQALAAAGASEENPQGGYAQQPQDRQPPAEPQTAALRSVSGTLAEAR